MPRKLATGEVVSTVASDAIRLGDVYDVTARFIGSIVAYAVVTVLLLRSSVTLGVVVAVGVPALVSLLALVIRPLQKAQAAQREAAGALTTLGADTVAGLRVLRGVGGEQVFLRRYATRSQQVREAGVRVAGVQAGLDALQVLLPGGFIVLVTWLGARAAVSGSISAGELVAFYGYAAFLVQPVRTATEMLQKATRGHVASVRVLAVLAVDPAVSDPADPATSPGPHPGLDDPATGIRVEPGRLTALVSARPADTAAAAERLARLTDKPSGEKPLPSARLGGVPVDRLRVEEVRRRVVLADSDPRLFTGWVRSQLDPSGSHDDADLLAVLHTAAAHDVLDGLPKGLDDEIDERGRSLSGGQRQRLSLARALLTDAETLVLIEPTSAVDAHTEAVIADRLTAARAGRTTVVVSASPLLLDRADSVVFLGPDGAGPTYGTHHELLRRDDAVGAAYRHTVTRGEDA
jgi:ABC-type multidrug transport system fused ATPase/permease subunit